MPQDRPNIILIMTDQHRADAIGAAGNTVINTPNLDRLAGEGVLFDRMYSTSPVCMPMRASFATGRYPHNTGVVGNSGQMLPQEITFMQQLAEAGYHNSLVGKTHFFGHASEMDIMAHEHIQHEMGFADVHELTGKMASRRCDSYYTHHLRAKSLLETHRTDSRGRTDKPIWFCDPSPLPEEDHIDGYLGDQAARWVDEHEGTEPFFLMASFSGPHDPWDPPGRYATMYDPNDMPPFIEDDLSGKPENQKERAEKQRTLSDMTDEDVAKTRAAYYGNTTLIDDGIGKLFDTLTRRGFMDDALIIYTSDHGELLGDHRMFQKSMFYESAARIPGIVRWPGHIQGNRRTDALSECIDLSATILDAAGLTPPPKTFGRSLLPLLTAKKLRRHRDMVFSELATWKMVCTERWKYTYDPTEGGPQELYGLESDPQEQNNLIKSNPGIGSDLRRALLDWLIDTEAALNG